MIDHKLKPCPFCGEKRKSRIIHQNFSGEYRVEHFCEHFTILGREFFRTEEAAIEAWNRRVNDEN